MRFLFVFIFLLFQTPNYSQAYEYSIAIGAIFKDEAPYLKEWIEFHKLVGVEHFYLYNHYSEDNYKEVLEPYIHKGDVTLIEWTFPDFSYYGFSFEVQPGAYKDCLTLANGKVKWLALIDIDEFLTPITSNKLIDILDEYEEFGGVVFHWHMFGTSNLASLPKNKLMIEALNLRYGGDNVHWNRVKSVVRPERVVDCKEPHVVFYQDGFFHVNSNKDYYYFELRPFWHDKLVINHYWTRAEDFCFEKKYKKWNGYVGLDFESFKTSLVELNTVQDDTMLRFISPLRLIMGLDSLIVD